MTRETPAFHPGRSGSDADERLVPPQGPYWDLDLLTPDDVCASLKVKKSWLYDAVENGALEAIRLGKQLRFRPSALIRYLDARAGSGNLDHVEDSNKISPHLHPNKQKAYSGSLPRRGFRTAVTRPEIQCRPWRSSRSAAPSTAGHH